MKRKPLYFLFFIFLILGSPAHAYADPGVALGALIVFLTVVITSIFSFGIIIFRYFKKNLKNLSKIVKKTRKKKLRQKRNR